MVLLVHLVEAEGGVHLLISACISRDELHANRFVSFQTTLDAVQFSVNVPESLEPDYVLIPFHQGVIPQCPLDATVFVTYGYMPYNPNWLIESVASH